MPVTPVTFSCALPQFSGLSTMNRPSFGENTSAAEKNTSHDKIAGMSFPGKAKLSAALNQWAVLYGHYLPAVTHWAQQAFKAITG